MASLTILGNSFHADSDRCGSDFRSGREISSDKSVEHGKGTSDTVDCRSNDKDCGFSFEEGQLINVQNVQTVD